MMLIRTASLLLPLLAAPALATSPIGDAAPVDLVAAIFIGFTGDGTAMVNGDQIANVTRDGPGRFSGGIEDHNASFTFVVDEVSPCIFEATYAQDGDAFTVSFDIGGISTMSFEEQEPAPGFVYFMLTMETEQGAVEVIMPDGRHPGGNTNRIGTSLTLAELDAAIAALQRHCPPR